MTDNERVRKVSTFPATITVKREHSPHKTPEDLAAGLEQQGHTQLASDIRVFVRAYVSSGGSTDPEDLKRACWEFIDSWTAGGPQQLLEPLDEETIAEIESAFEPETGR